MVPTGVFDFDQWHYVWANDAALDFWRAESRTEFLARDFSQTPPSVRQRMQGNHVHLRAGRSLAEEWTLYPRGTPIPVRMHLAPIPLDDGRIGGLQQLIVHEQRQDPALLRGIEALLHSSVLVALVRDDGSPLHQNPTCQRVHPDGALVDWFVDRPLAEALLREAVAGEVVRREAQMRDPDGPRWYSVEARPVRDPVTGVMSVLVQCTDQSARIDAEQAAEQSARLVTELRGALDVVEAQRLEILSLSAPLIAVGHATLAVPIIGTLDGSRAAEISGRLLPAIVCSGAQVVLLDFTGLTSLQTDDVAALRKLVAAIGLLGAHAVVTGISPELARTLVAAGQTLAAPAYRSLAEGLAATRAARG